MARACVCAGVRVPPLPLSLCPPPGPCTSWSILPGLAAGVARALPERLRLRLPISLSLRLPRLRGRGLDRPRSVGAEWWWWCGCSTGLMACRPAGPPRPACRERPMACTVMHRNCSTVCGLGGCSVGWQAEDDVIISLGAVQRQRRSHQRMLQHRNGGAGSHGLLGARLTGLCFL